MKIPDFKIGILYAVLILYLIFGHIIFVDKLIENYALCIHPLFWLCIYLVANYVFKNDKERIRAKTDKVQTVFIVILFYLILWFLAGLFVGYVKSPYAHSFLGIFQNIWSFLVIIIFQEYIRSILVQYTKGKFYLHILIVIIFSLFEINFFGIASNFKSGEAGFKYASSIIFPILIKQVICTYLAIVAGCLAAYAYRLPLILANLILPIYPNFDWFMTAILGSILPLCTYFAVQSVHEKRMARDYHRRKKKGAFFKQVPPYLIFFIFICFVAGFFKYAPTAIMSNSMSKLILRGDVVVIEKLNVEGIKKLQINDIIEYRLDNYKVVHRIVDIKIKDEQVLFITKGDNNNAIDTEPVSIEQVVGVVRFKIPKVGYPSVWLSEFFTNTKPNVET